MRYQSFRTTTTTTTMALAAILFLFVAIVTVDLASSELVQVAELLPTDPRQNTQFGRHLAIDGTRAIVGGHSSPTVHIIIIRT